MKEMILAFSVGFIAIGLTIALTQEEKKQVAQPDHRIKTQATLNHEFESITRDKPKVKSKCLLIKYGKEI